MHMDKTGPGPEAGRWTASSRQWRIWPWGPEQPDAVAGGPDRSRTWLLLSFAMLVGLADLLFLGRSPGLSTAVFALILIAVARLACGPLQPVRGDLGSLGLLVLAVLPVVELVQGLSLLALGSGLLAVAVRLALSPHATAQDTVRGALRFARHFPGISAAGAIQGVRWLARPGRGSSDPRALARTWVLPGVAGLALAALLVAANPVLSLWAEELRRVPLHPERILRHGAFWIVAGFLIWPFVSLGLDRGWLVRAETSLPARPLMASPDWVNGASVRNSLVLFNLLLGVQTLLDLGYLWGGIELPEGVTPAQYAHRGAYPLVATALLAGVFTLAARPFVEGRPGLRVLLGLWIAQNVLLVISSMLRLDLYVNGFGLTRWRLAAGIWMGLVAGGLVLTAWQVWRGHSSGWLLARVAAMAGLVLYLCCFVNAADLIARVNLTRFERVGVLDREYLCNLGPGAGPAIRAHENRSGYDLCGLAQDPDLAAPVAKDWREWGFRNWRLRRYAEAAQATEGNGE